MIDIYTWLAAGTGLLGAAAASINMGRLLRAQLRHRALVQQERERTTRSIARTTGLAHLFRHPPARIRIIERDDDGERLIEIGGPADSGETAAR